MNIDLFVFDLDGTALGGYEPYDRLPDRFSSFLDQLSDEGVHWCTNTTWHPTVQVQMIDRSAVRSRPALMFGRTGLMKARYDQGAQFDSQWDQLSDELDKRFVDDVWPAIGQVCRLKPIEGECLMQAVVSEPAQEGALEALMKEHEVYRVGDVLQPTAMSKGFALSNIQQELGVTPFRTMVAGDETNDLTMFDRDLASYQVCPGNAAPEVSDLVKSNGGIQGRALYSDGVIEAAHGLLH